MLKKILTMMTMVLLVVSILCQNVTVTVSGRVLRPQYPGGPLLPVANAAVYIEIANWNSNNPPFFLELGTVNTNSNGEYSITVSVPQSAFFAAVGVRAFCVRTGRFVAQFLQWSNPSVNQMSDLILDP